MRVKKAASGTRPAATSRSMHLHVQLGCSAPLAHHDLTSALGDVRIVCELYDQQLRPTNNRSWAVGVTAMCLKRCMVQWRTLGTGISCSL